MKINLIGLLLMLVLLAGCNSQTESPKNEDQETQQTTTIIKLVCEPHDVGDAILLKCKLRPSQTK